MRHYFPLLLLLLLCALVPAQQVVRRPIAAAAGEPLLTNLAASWKLSDLTDASGNGNTLTNNNTATFNTGHIGNAVYTVISSSQSLSIASNAFVQAGDVDFTFDLWVYPVAAQTMVALSKTGDTAGQDEYVLYFTGSTDSKMNFGVYTATDSFHSVTSTTALSLSAWAHVTVWHDATANTINIKINNGATDSAGTTGSLQAASNASFRLGANGETGNDLFWEGRIDAVSFWKRTLTAGEITRLENSGAGCEWNFSGCP